MRKRFSYANVAATLALVFSMSGGALAANHYLISSTKQISPKVLKKLKGNAGPKGTAGATGATGAAGKEGPQGKAGAEGKEGKAGASATKLFAVISSAGEVIRGSGVVSATKEGGSAYIVKFNQNITQCAFVGTVGTTSFSGVERGDLDVAGANATTDSVYVETYTHAGAAEAKSFHLAVFC
jgi:hypothetical protein